MVFRKKVVKSNYNDINIAAFTGFRNFVYVHIFVYIL